MAFLLFKCGESSAEKNSLDVAKYKEVLTNTLTIKKALTWKSI